MKEKPRFTLLCLLNLLLSLPAFGQSMDFPSWLASMENFGGSRAAAPLSVECQRQGYGDFRRNVGMLDSKALRIGDTVYQQGVCTHANAVLKFSAKKPVAAFRAWVGVEGHAKTRGGDGSVRFAVKSPDGRVMAQSAVCRGGENAVELSANLEGANTFTIEVDDAGDGIRCDSAVLADIEVRFLDGTTATLGGCDWLTATRLPFSFVYDGKYSDDVLRGFRHAVTREKTARGTRTIHRWSESRGGLSVVWGIESLEGANAAEFTLSFENDGSNPTRILEKVNVIRQDLSAPLSVETLTGGTNGWPADAFKPDIWDGNGSLVLDCRHGRSSSKFLPFWVIGNHKNEGLFYGLGWTGQWIARFETKGNITSLAAGMEFLRLSLKPGERISQPSVLMGYYRGDILSGDNALRSVLYRHYTPNLGREKPLPPISWNHWFVFQSDIDEAKLISEVNAMRGLGIEYFCVDASWFASDFWNVGDWRVNAQKFPNGLESVSRAIGDAGMKMGLWFEPERVTEKDYPAFPDKSLLVPAADGQPYTYHGKPVRVWLVNLGLPSAQKWMIDLIGGYARRLDLKWIRYDFNYRLLKTWKALDAAEPDREGISEIRYIEGLYAVLDALLKNHPDMIIEWCSSGGLRIDLETLRRSHTFWKSDLTGLADQTKPQITGGNLFLPANYLNSNLGVLKTDYDYVGQFGGALGFNRDFRHDTPEQLAKTRAMISVYKGLRALLLKEYYPLFEYTSDLTKWDGWQFHDSATGRGVFMVLRPEDSPYASAVVKLRGLDPARAYRLTPLVGSAPVLETTGRALSDGWLVSIASARGAVVVEYLPLPR